MPPRVASQGPDSGASKSFFNPKIVDRLPLEPRRLEEECLFTVANGEKLRTDRVVNSLTMWCGDLRLRADLLVVPVPYDLVLGFDWLTEQ